MGYLSTGHGTLTIINKTKIKEIQKFLNKEVNVEYSINGRNEFEFSFYNWKMYYSKAFFKKLAKYFNTKNSIEVNGEDSLDIWRIHLKDGEINVQLPKSIEWNKIQPLGKELGK